MDLVIWTYIFGGATIFGFIVGVFSVWNGRMTRRELRQVMEAGDRRTQELIQEMDRRHTALLERMDGRMEQLGQYMQETGQRYTALLERMDNHMQEMDRRHTELLTEVLRRVS